jgi:hypothetical protein
VREGEAEGEGEGEREREREGRAGAERGALGATFFLWTSMKMSDSSIISS